MIRIGHAWDTHKLVEGRKLILGGIEFESEIGLLGHSDADVVLHAESFYEEQILKTKYSFSTKIVDYLQSGSVILAVGPDEISSIKYLSKIPGVCVIDEMERIEEGLTEFLSDTSKFYERSENIYEFAKKNHDASVVSVKMNEMLKSIVEGGV